MSHRVSRDEFSTAARSERRDDHARGGIHMGKVLTHMTMSLDGFIANPDDTPGELFDWYGAGDVSVASANDDVSFAVDAASAEVLRDLTANVGALVCGRRL